MTICRVCSAEITGPDRYCRNCGAPVAPLVAEWDDTRRFNPSTPLPATPLPAAAPVMPDTTNPLYAPPPAGYGAEQGPAPLYRTASLARKLLKWKFIWALIFLIAISFIGLGIGIVIDTGDRREIRAMERAEEDAELVRRSYQEAVQNALGFKQGSFSAAEFPGAQGIFVNSLMSDDSPAALAGIQAGDLLTELNNQVVRNNSELSKVLDSLQTGGEVPLIVYRDGATISLRIKIGDRHFPPLQPKTEPQDQGFLGILESSRRCCIPGSKKWGVEVTELHVNGPAELFGLRPGDVITEFNGHPVKTPNEFNRLIRAVKPRSQTPVTLYRDNTEKKIEVIIGRRW